MVIFRSEVRTESPAGMIAALVAAQLRAPAPSHDAIVSWLIDAGELEAGVADEVNDGSEPPTPIERLLRRGLCDAALAFVSSWRNRGDAETHLNHAAMVLASGTSRFNPKTIRVNTPEGYAHYGVYPEAYLEAAERFVAEKQPTKIVVFGIRSIGTSLSAVVAATCACDGCEVASFTVRPSGHPYDRRLQFNPAWSRELRRWHDAWFAVVDEGPGRSGSSFAAVVDALERLGISGDRIVLFPSWDAPPNAMLSEHARGVWSSHHRYVAEFDRTWIDGGPLGSIAGNGQLFDASAGRWRDLERQDVTTRSPVWPQMERRKFVVEDDDGGARLLKFAGLGRYGHRKIERARVLGASGFTNSATHLQHGFIVEPWLQRAAPVAWSDRLSDACAGYLAFVARHFPLSRGVGAGETLAMIKTNLPQGIGADAAPLIAYAERRASMFGSRPVALDGRMLPDEWVADGTRLIKTDALDHHDDHLFPGPQNIAWDVAGTCLEFELNGNDAQRFVAATASHLGDQRLSERLPLFEIAYLAFRLGYADTAAAAMAGSHDGNLFAQRASRCRELLRARARVAA